MTMRTRVRGSHALEKVFLNYVPVAGLKELVFHLYKIVDKGNLSLKVHRIFR